MNNNLYLYCAARARYNFYVIRNNAVFRTQKRVFEKEKNAHARIYFTRLDSITVYRRHAVIFVYRILPISLHARCITAAAMIVRVAAVIRLCTRSAENDHEIDFRTLRPNGKPIRLADVKTRRGGHNGRPRETTVVFVKSATKRYLLNCIQKYTINSFYMFIAEIRRRRD